MRDSCTRRVRSIRSLSNEVENDNSADLNHDDRFMLSFNAERMAYRS